MITIKLLKKRKGAVLPLVAIVIIVLLGFTMLVVDAGSMYIDRREMATAADAGALAGAKELSNSNGASTAKAKQIAVEIAEQNGADIGEVKTDIKTIDGIQVIEVTVKKTKDTYFAKIFGINSTNVGARSVATWGYIKDYAGGSIMPLFSFDKDFTLGVATLKGGKIEGEIEGSGKKFILNSNYGYLDFGSGASIIKDILEVKNYTIPHSIINNIEIGGELEGENGNKQSHIKPIETRMQDALKINVGDDLKIAARKQYMSGLIPIIDYEKFLNDNVTVDYEKDGVTIKKIKVENKIKLTIKYFAIFEIQDVVDNEPKGSPHALDKLTYEKVSTSQTYTGEKKGTIIGEFTDSYINVDVDHLNNDQTNPNPGGYAAKYFKLIDADYIGD